MDVTDHRTQILVSIDKNCLVTAAKQEAIPAMVPIESLPNPRRQQKRKSKDLTLYAASALRPNCSAEIQNNPVKQMAVVA
jgi:hypothetical protein